MTKPYLKSLFLATLSLLISIMAWTQSPHDSRSNDRIESMRIAYITDQLNLSPSEARDFWPIYNQFNDSMSKLREEERALIENEEAIDEAKAKIVISRLISIEEEELSIEKAYVLNLSKILGYQKSLKLRSLERNFKRELISKMKKRDKR